MCVCVCGGGGLKLALLRITELVGNKKLGTAGSGKK
jgi:hypothetical protein